MYPLADRVLSTALSTYVRARCRNTITLFALALLEHMNEIQVDISMGNLTDLPRCTSNGNFGPSLHSGPRDTFNPPPLPCVVHLIWWCTHLCRLLY